MSSWEFAKENWEEAKGLNEALFAEFKKSGNVSAANLLRSYQVFIEPMIVLANALIEQVEARSSASLGLNEFVTKIHEALMQAKIEDGSPLREAFIEDVRVFRKNVLGQCSVV